MSNLSQQELIRIRRAAEDAAYAMNRNYKPFIDVVSHPLNIIALVDIAQKSDELQKRLDEIIQQSKDFIRSCKNDAEIFEDTNAAGKAYGAEAVVELLEQALNGGAAK